MAANGISTLLDKEQRQIAKLELAQTKRKAGGNINATAYRELNTYDVNLLPMRYVLNVPTDNASPLLLGRPWS
jgi:hypothetical protein